MQKSHLHIAVRRSGAFLSDSFRYEAFGKSFKTRGSLRPSQFGKISKRLSLFMVFIAFPIRKIFSSSLARIRVAPHRTLTMEPWIRCTFNQLNGNRFFPYLPFRLSILRIRF